MSYANNIAAIVARLNTVPNLGVISNYRRNITTWDSFNASFTININGVKQVRAADVSWESGDLSPAGSQSDGRERMAGMQTYVVRMYMGVKDADATDRTFSGLVEAVRTALVTFAAALVAPTPRQLAVPVVVRQNGFSILGGPGEGGALIHYAEISTTFYDSEIV